MRLPAAALLALACAAGGGGAQTVSLQGMLGRLRERKLAFHIAGSPPVVSRFVIDP